MATSPLLQPAERPDGVPDPYQVYLNRLKTAESRRTMRSALDSIIILVMEDERSVPEDRVRGDDRPWWLLRAADVQYIQDLMASRVPPLGAASVNKKLAALRGVLEECWNLGLMSSDDYLRTVRELKTLPVGDRG